MARVAREPALIAGDAPVDRADYSAYRYVLNLPGATTGSYSKNLNHLWALGAVVMLWDAPFVEWHGRRRRRSTRIDSRSGTSSRRAGTTPRSRAARRTSSSTARR